MNISIIGPEDSGKTTFVNNLAKQAAFGRPVYFTGLMPSPFKILPIDQYHTVKNCVCIMDDINAFFDNSDLYAKGKSEKEEVKRFKAPIIMSKNWNRLNIFIFHSEADAVKFFYRQSRYIYFSCRYRYPIYEKSEYVSGIAPKVVGRRPFEFFEFKRY
jgi:hypothetical protein